MRKTHELLGNVTKSHCRSTSSLKSQAIKWARFDHWSQSRILGPLVELKSLLSIPVIWDAEDFHRGETDESSRISRKIQKLEDLCIPQLRTITAASPLIGKAYKSLYPSLVVHTINNDFPSSKGCRPIPNVDQPLALVWFSQILGLDRGLKEFLKCLKFLPETPLRITFIGAASNEIKSEIKQSLTSEKHELAIQETIRKRNYSLFSHTTTLVWPLERSSPRIATSVARTSFTLTRLQDVTRFCPKPLPSLNSIQNTRKSVN